MAVKSIGPDADYAAPADRLAAARTLVATIGHRAKFSVIELTGDCRHTALCAARHYAMWACVKTLGLSHSAVGRLFGDRDHTTVLYAVKKHESRLRTKVFNRLWLLPGHAR